MIRYDLENKESVRNAPALGCSRCGEGIYEGESYIEKDDGDLLCGFCLETMNAMELVKELELEKHTAEANELYE